MALEEQMQMHAADAARRAWPSKNGHAGDRKKLRSPPIPA